MPWILIVGPYWVPVIFGPFTDTELDIRLNNLDDDGDWEETDMALMAQSWDWDLPELYLLCDATSFARLEQIISATDALAQPLRDAFMTCEFQQV